MTVAGRAQVSGLCNHSRAPLLGSYTNTFGAHGTSCHMGLQEPQPLLPEGASVLSSMALFFLGVLLRPQHSRLPILGGTRLLEARDPERKTQLHNQQHPAAPDGETEVPSRKGDIL